MASYFDNFNRADGALGANWAKHASSPSGVIQVAGTRAAETTGSDYGVYYYVSQAATDDHFVQVTLRTIPTSTDKTIQIGLRAAIPSSGGWPDGYGYGADYNSGAAPNRHLFKFVSGSFSSILSGVTSPAYIAGEILRMEAEGSTIRCFVNGAHIAGSPTTDTSHSGSGKRYFYLVLRNGAVIDDFTAGDLEAPTTSQAFFPMSSFIVQ